MTARERVADLWDAVIAEWRPGQDTWPEPLDRWQASYSGKGAGAVDLGQYPDPWVGDLRGMRDEPELIVLGLNPGVGYDELQGASGDWTRAIGKSAYSRCFERSPEEDPDRWTTVHGKRSPYWVRLEKFAQRWLQDDTADHRRVLNLELYPWHSPSLTAGITSPPDVVRDLVLDPVAECSVSEVFAFGAPWFGVADSLGLRELARWGKAGEPWDPAFGDWTVHVYQLGVRQRLVVSRQSGYSGPPGAERVEALRERLRHPYAARR